MNPVVFKTLIYISCFFATFLFWGLSLNNDFLQNPVLAEKVGLAWIGIAFVILPALGFYLFIRKLIEKEKYKFAFLICCVFGLLGFLMPYLQKTIFN